MASVSHSPAYCGVFISAVPAWFVLCTDWFVVVSVGFLSLLCTSMSLMFLFRLYATIGISGHKILSFGSFSITCQCCLRICPMWVYVYVVCVCCMSNVYVGVVIFSLGEGCHVVCVVVLC